MNPMIHRKVFWFRLQMIRESRAESVIGIVSISRRTEWMGTFIYPGNDFNYWINPFRFVRAEFPNHYSAHLYPVGRAIFVV